MRIKIWQQGFLAVLAAGLLVSPAVYASEAGISAKEFVERYNAAVEKYNSVADSEGLAVLSPIDEGMLKEDELWPDGTMKFSLNADSVDKDTLGHLEVWTDEADELGNSRITLGIALAVYAFDTSMEEVTEATQLYVDLLTGEDPGEHPAAYTLEKKEKTVRLEGKYSGYVPVTPTPTPAPAGTSAPKSGAARAGATRSEAQESAVSGSPASAAALTQAPADQAP